MLVHAYDLTQSLNDQVGDTALIAHGGSSTSGGYAFGAGQGLQLTNPLQDLTTFSIVVDFSFDAATGYRKIIDFQSLGPDSGLYSYYGNLNFYPVVTASASDIIAGNPVQMVITRDGDTSLVTGYVNGVQAIAFTDSSNLAVLNSTANGLYFFMDDGATGQGENSGGTATRLLLFANVLTADQVQSLAQNQLSLSIPEPSTVWLLVTGLGWLGLTAWRRRRLRP